MTKSELPRGVARLNSTEYQVAVKHNGEQVAFARTKSLTRALGLLRGARTLIFEQQIAEIERVLSTVTVQR